jgi:uncharacterized membrane protein
LVGVRDTGIFEGTAVDGKALTGFTDLMGARDGATETGLLVGLVESVGAKVSPYFVGTWELAAEMGAVDGAAELGFTESVGQLVGLTVFSVGFIVLAVGALDGVKVLP